MKLWVQGAFGLAISLFALGNAQAAGQPGGCQNCTIYVYPTGQFPADLQAVQAAVDAFGQTGRNGTVYLKAHNRAGDPTAFNFGTDADPTLRGSIVVTSSQAGALTFEGQVTQDARASIVGGNIPINFQRRDRLVVRNIEFRRAYLHAILVQATTGAVIEDNMILDTEGVTSEGAFPLSRAISFRGLSLGESEDITGRVTIRGNLIERSNATFIDGIHLVFTDASFRIVDNLVTDMNVGVRSTFHTKPITIARNHFTTRRSDILFTAGVLLDCGVGDDVVVRIRDNFVDANGSGVSVSGSNLGVFGFAPDVECPISDMKIVGNDLSADIFAAIEVATIASTSTRIFGVRIANNTIRGSAPTGIAVYDLSPLFGLSGTVDIFDNRISNNSFENFQGPTDVFLDAGTRDNVVRVLEGDTVVDEGTNNRIVTRRLPVGRGPPRQRHPRPRGERADPIPTVPHTLVSPIGQFGGQRAR